MQDAVAEALSNEDIVRRILVLMPATQLVVGTVPNYNPSQSSRCASLGLSLSQNVRAVVRRHLRYAILSLEAISSGLCHHRHEAAQIRPWQGRGSSAHPSKNPSLQRIGWLSILDRSISSGSRKE